MGRLLAALVVVLAAAGALLALPRRPWTVRLMPSPVRRAAYGALAGAIIGLLLIPALGLVAALAFLLAGLAVLAAAAIAILLLGRALSGRR